MTVGEKSREQRVQGFSPFVKTYGFATSLIRGRQVQRLQT